MTLTGFYLLDHPNPSGDHFYRTRRDEIQGVVLHITAGLEDLDAIADHSAESTAQYAASTDREVSWHKGADSDSIVTLLPDQYTAWHCGDYNPRTLGLEISKATVDWTAAPEAWVSATLHNAAKAAAPWVRAYNIPCIRRTKAEFDTGLRGFVAHADLDPARRTDPGKTFPWARYLDLVNIYAYYGGNMGIADDHAEGNRERLDALGLLCVGAFDMRPYVGDKPKAPTPGSLFGRVVRLEGLPGKMDLLIAQLDAINAKLDKLIPDKNEVDR